MAGSASGRAGTVLAVDRNAGTLVLGEVGPWRVERGETRITRLAIATGSATEFTVAERVPDGAAGFPGAFAERRLDPGHVKASDFVGSLGLEQSSSSPTHTTRYSWLVLLYATAGVSPS